MPSNPTPRSLVDMTIQALERELTDSFWIRKVNNGSYHEDELVHAVWALLAENGAKADMCTMCLSNHPLEKRAEPGEKPADYRFIQRDFLVVDDRYVRIDVRQNELVIENHDRDGAVQSMARSVRKSSTDEMSHQSLTIQSGKEGPSHSSVELSQDTRNWLACQWQALRLHRIMKTTTVRPTKKPTTRF